MPNEQHSAAETRRIDLMPLTALVSSAHAKNPKKHDTGTIHSSVARFGFVEPIILDGRTNKIISGHGRTKTLAAMFARGDAPPEGVSTAEDGTWLVPVVAGWSSRSDTEAHGALIALNRTTELGGWDTEALLDLLDDLKNAEDGLGDSLSGIGYTDDDYTSLQRRLAADTYMSKIAGEEAPTADDSMDLLRSTLQDPSQLDDTDIDLGFDPTEQGGQAVAEKVLEPRHTEPPAQKASSPEADEAFTEISGTKPEEMVFNHVTKVVTHSPEATKALHELLQVEWNENEPRRFAAYPPGTRVNRIEQPKYSTREGA